MSTHIIIVNYNSGAWLGRALRSALTQSQAHISVVDNASSDDSIAAAKAVVNDHQNRITWLLNDENIGFAAANNQVLKTLVGKSHTGLDIDAGPNTHTGPDKEPRQTGNEFAVLMNPDCELGERTLDILLQAFDTHPKFGLASCRILNEDGTLQPTCRRRFPTPWSALVRLLKLDRIFANNPRFENFDYGADVSESDPIQTVEAISGAFMVARLSAVEQVGLLDEAYFMHCEDLDWCKRFGQAGWSVGFVPQATVLHAKGVSSKSRPIRVLWTLHRGMSRFFDKFYRNDTRLPLRLAVKLGIVLSFIARAGVSLLKSLFNAKGRT